MDPQEPTSKRPKATRIEEDSFAFNRVIPLVLIALAVITAGVIVAAVLVVLGVF